jgi:transcriptional regulator with XRE-family HTH domain
MCTLHPMITAEPRETMRILRVAKNLSQQELADAAGISRRSVFLIENGLRPPRRRTRIALADALCAVESYLFPEPEDTEVAD